MYHPISALRRAGRRLGTLLLALLATCSLVSTSGVTTAHAQPAPNSRWTAVDWHLETYDDADNTEYGTIRAWTRRNQYNAFIRNFREAVSQQMGGNNNDRDLMDTRQSTATDRIIEVRVWTNQNNGPAQSHVVLYFNAANLYLVGFTSHGHHYQFQDSSPGQGVNDPVLRTNLAELYRAGYNLPNAPLFQNLGYRGNYPSLDPQGRRADAPYTPDYISYAVGMLSDHGGVLSPQSLRFNLAYIIGMTSEAARFGWIERRIDQSIAYGGDSTDPNRASHIGNFGLELELHWSDLSRLTHRSVAGNTAPSVTIDGRTYTNATQVAIGTMNTQLPRIAPFIALLGSR
ncbi:ribosome-inactivating family protein [Kitasatospora sp. NPDC094011]|uniref:ribosome-inactivating family protein n=1 Tax=Kitasatospora sp. NPDC094011 TaxID=3364090 RepID=UPI003830E906